MAALIPIAAIGLYLLIGSPQAVDPAQVAGESGAHGISAQQIEALVQKLAERMEKNPEDGEGWKMLGRSYSALGRHKAASEAYAKAAARLPKDSQLLADFADSLAMVQGRSLEGEPEKLVLRALEIDPANLKALALAGTAAYERKDFAAAARFWERMLPHVEPNSQDAQQIQSNIQEARSLAGEKPPAKPSASQPAAQGTRLSGEVRLAPELKGKVSPNDTVFIFARASEGPQLPLAVLRKQVRELPSAFTLDDSMSMSADMSLSKFPTVVVGARISRSGSATPQPGDLQGLSAPVKSNASGVTVVIASEVR
jgi:cytochrome c-type biogenesis protein CcmH